MRQFMANQEHDRLLLNVLRKSLPESVFWCAQVHLLVHGVRIGVVIRNDLLATGFIYWIADRSEEIPMREHSPNHHPQQKQSPGGQSDEVAFVGSERDGVDLATVQKIDMNTGKGGQNPLAVLMKLCAS